MAQLLFVQTLVRVVAVTVVHHQTQPLIRQQIQRPIHLHRRLRLLVHRLQPLQLRINAIATVQQMLNVKRRTVDSHVAKENVDLHQIQVQLNVNQRSAQCVWT